ncbi:hypothetical protein [Xanthomonas sp. 3058]|uniref:hypothetical protein n=1 Tax=Xanthomonas sp. 3058 TaxID=3035314 RepID=UPI001607982B|nr:hypothetical protein [Xanthomonas sp. 3058]MBB5863781.1 hypothetical protein [Xanthomonas sp. 3058]
MAGLVLDAQLHSLARHLVKVDHRVDVSKEIRYLNDRYGFVPEEQFSKFDHDLNAMYEFEKNRQVNKLNAIGYAQFKLDQVTGNAALESHDSALSAQLGLINA